MANPPDLHVWEKILISVTQRLIECNCLNLEDWQKIDREYSQLLKKKFSPIHISSVIALITIPLSLFFHDNPPQLRRQLQDCLQVWQQPPDTLESLLIWHRVIALIIREKASPPALISQFIQGELNGETLLIGKLKWIEGEPIPIKSSTYSSLISENPAFVPLVLALYYFSCTPDDFRICVLRAQKSPYQPKLTTPLTGILAGVYNGWSGVPIVWRLELKHSQNAQIIHQQALRLLAVWSGVAQNSELNLISQVAIASPKVIQPRALLNIISQKDL
jgi:hypothetical protein